MNSVENSASLKEEVQQHSIAADLPAIVVIGAGPVGMGFLRSLSSKINMHQPVVVYGGEPCKPYDRVRLSSYLAGEVLKDELNIEDEYSENARIEYRYNCPVTRIDRKEKIVFDTNGGSQKYSKLVLAVGSKPYIPTFGNSHYKGVYSFRTIHEADELLARKTRSTNVVIIGGGLLGLETARAMQQYNTHITIVEHNSRLMMQQLDEEGAESLQEYVESTGIDVVLNDSIVSVEGKWCVEHVLLRSGKKIQCDTVIIAAGIRPNVQLALDAGISCNKGIRINDRLQTSDDDIYAIGECAEHNNEVYGLVKPGLEQASVLAERMAGGYARYRGSLDSAQLKVMSKPVFSSGRTGVYEESRASVNEYIYRSSKDGLYRKIRIFGNRIIGVVSVGDWHESVLVQEAIQEKRRVWFWQLLKFKVYGNLWGDAEELDISSWPSTAIICNCTGVTHGELSKAIGKGCETIECVKKSTRASSVCGSCQPLVSEMLGNNVQIQPDTRWRSLMILCLLSFVTAGMIMLSWPIPYNSSAVDAFQWDQLWRDTLFKQISGFSVLGLFVVGLAISLRKRVKKINVGEYGLWRLAHIFLGVGALIMLVVHSGFRLGSDLNFILMMNFLLLALAGAYAGFVVSTEHKLAPLIAKQKRARWNKYHLLLFWPVPVLLGFHILKTYYF